jgi:hypothetical protein
MKKKIKLLPCPFCGALPKFRFNRDHGPEVPENFWALGCENKQCSVLPLATATEKPDAVKQWNTRS